MTRTIRRFSGQRELAQAAADDFVTAVNKSSGDVALGLCGGRSVSLFYRECVTLFHRIKRPERISFFLVDERFAPDQRNATQIFTELIAPLLADKIITDDQVHFSIHGKTLDEMNQELNDHLSSYRESRVMDLLILGVGEDGHIAGLFPDHPLLDSKGKGYGSFSDSPKPPAGRITLLPESIRGSQNAFVFCVGPTKKDAFEHLVSTSTITKTLPATLVFSLPSVWIYQTDGEQ